jgi:hypothetical protein
MAVHMAGSVEDSPGCSLHSLVVAGLRRRGCSRNLDYGLGRSSLAMTCWLSL